VLVILSVRHPRLPFGLLWVPVLSFVVYLAAWGARLAIRFAPPDKVGGKIPLDTARLGWLVTGAARELLCAGSYTFLDVTVPAQEVRVRITVL
jgi:hypothetical protein